MNDSDRYLEQMEYNDEAQHRAGMMWPVGVLILGIVACALAIAFTENPQDHAALGMENEELREDVALAHDALELFTRNEGSCAVRNNGPRVFCWMIEGNVYRRPLEPNEYVAVKSARRTER